MRATIALATTLLAGACVFGFRGEAEFSGAHDLAGVTAVRVDLPSTPLSVFGCDPDAPGTCAASLRYEGRWLATGGTRADARRHASAPALAFERDDALAWLQADIPLATRGLVDLELEAMELPGDRDLELHTDLGDVDVAGMTGAVTVEVGVGNVHVDGGDGGVAVTVDHGDATVRGAGDAFVTCEVGRVEIDSTATGRDLFVHAPSGAVVVTLTSAIDVTYDIRAGGTIRVGTEAAVVVTDGHWRRRVGDGTAQVVITAGGDVRIDEHDG